MPFLINSQNTNRQLPKTTTNASAMQQVQAMKNKGGVFERLIRNLVEDDKLVRVVQDH